MKRTLKRIVGARNAGKLGLCRSLVLLNTRRLLGGVLPGRFGLLRTPARIFSSKKHHIFFGYYDITPFSKDESLLLAIHAPPVNETPRIGSEVKVGWYDLRNAHSEFHETGKTSTWCWQQGCRLQWYPSDDSRTVLYNSLVDGTYGCVVQDIYTGEIKRRYPRAAYCVSPNGSLALSLNFSRLQRLRPGYGYSNLSDETRGVLLPRDDGLWRMNMHTGKSTLLFSLADIAAYAPTESMRGAEHYFNHLLFSPDGSRFLFIHLWNSRGNRCGRMITSDLAGGNIHLLNNEGHTSHYSWKSNTEILAFATHKELGSHYYLYDDTSENRKVIAQGILTEDGHPSFSRDGGTIVTDTYPDKYSVQRLLMYRIDTDELLTLFECLSPLSYRGEVRCDLHPRISPCESYVCVDSIVKGRRAMSVFNVKAFI